MQTPDTLRQFAAFGTLTNEYLKAIAAITTELNLKKGAVIFEEGKPAADMFLLVEGKAELFYVVEETHSNVSKEFGAGEISVGELFGLSALFEPYKYETTAKTARESSILKIDGLELRKLIEKDRELAYLLMKQLVKIMNQKLQNTRAELAATRTVA